MDERDPGDFRMTEWPDWLARRDTWSGYTWSGYRWRRGAAVSTLFLLFLLEPMVDVFTSETSTLLRASVLANVLVYGLCYSVVLFRAPGMGRRTRVLAVVVLTVLGSGIAVILRDPTELTLLTYAIAVALFVLPGIISWTFGFCVAVLQIVLEWVFLGHVQWSDTSTLLLLTFVLGVIYHLINTMARLRQAREEVRHLAVADERARLARDLHDVLGHSLTTITVKSGLARRVLESGAERAQALAEVRDVEELARQALAEVRSTVSGYREASLAAELVGARHALGAAGIAAELPQAVDDVEPVVREVFAYVLREAVTNVVRHSGASRCEVRLGQSWIEVRDDGSGSESIVDTESAAGAGLAGLRERLAAVGGILHIQSLPEGGFLLRAGSGGAQAANTGASAARSA